MNIKLRPCRAEDCEAAIPLMFASGPDSFRYALSIDYEDEALGFLRYAFKKGEGEFGYKNHRLVLRDEVPVALMGVWEPKNNLSYMFNAMKGIVSYFGIRKGLRVLIRGLQVERVILPPRKGTLCLHNFAVDESLRGGGIGAKSINEFIEIAKEKKVDIVSLAVNENNLGAKKLYDRLGFKSVKKTKGGLKNKFGSVAGHFHMELKV